MSFTCLKCAKCMAELVDIVDPYKKTVKGLCWIWGQRKRSECDGHYSHKVVEVVITAVNEKTKTITVERVENGECGEIKS